MNKYLRYADILRKSRSKIELHVEKYICCSLPKTPDGNRLRSWVSNQLNGHYTYSIWLFFGKGIYVTSDQAREGRLQWLEHMIKLCEKWGKE